MLSWPGLEVVPPLCNATVPGSFQLGGARLRIMEFGFEGNIPPNSYEPCWKGSPEICLQWKWHHFKASLTQVMHNRWGYKMTPNSFNPCPCRVVCLLLLMVAVHAIWVLEQPRGSEQVLPRHVRFEWLCNHILYVL